MGAPIETDVVIVGAGPVGLFAVFQLGMMDMSCHLVDILDRAGGQCAELYPEKPIYDIPGHPSVLAGELVDKLLAQVAPFTPTFHFSRLVNGVTRGEDGRFTVTTDRDDVFLCKAVVIAAGGGAFQPRRAPIIGIEAYEGTSVHYSVRRRQDFAGQDVVIIGGGDSALDWTLSLAEIARSLTLIHRRDEFRAAPHSVHAMRKLVDEGRVTLKLGQVTKLAGEGGHLSGLTLKAADGSVEDLPATRMLPFFGLSAQLGPIAQWGLQLNENRITVDTEKFQTNVEGIFAIGDGCWYPGKLTLILSGFHEAALMTQAAKKLAVPPGEKVLFQHSTGSSLLARKLKEAHGG